MFHFGYYNNVFLSSRPVYQPVTAFNFQPVWTIPPTLQQWPQLNFSQFKPSIYDFSYKNSLNLDFKPSRTFDSLKLKSSSSLTNIAPKTSKPSVKPSSGKYDFDVRQKFTGSAADLNKNLGGVLTGKGNKFLELQEKYGISASVLAAIVNNESAYGKSNAAINKNNVSGTMDPKTNWMKLKTFESVDHCLEYTARNLKNNYIDKGLISISQIHAKYCPVGAANDPKGINGGWGSAVNSINNKIINSVA